jgi:hypothetical protein
MPFRSSQIDHPTVRAGEEFGGRRRNLGRAQAFQLMTVQTRSPRTRSRPRLKRRARRIEAEAQLPAAEPRALTPPPVQFAREREAGGPEDIACYRCSCGCIFQATVSTSVGCPHCGSTQAW